MGPQDVGVAVTIDPIREWQRGKQEQIAATKEALAAAQAEVAAERQKLRDEAGQDPPPVESLTAGGKPADYTPPNLSDQFREWARESIYRRGSQPPPAA